MSLPSLPTSSLGAVSLDTLLQVTAVHCTALHCTADSQSAMQRGAHPVCPHPNIQMFVSQERVEGGAVKQNTFGKLPDCLCFHVQRTGESQEQLGFNLYLEKEVEWSVVVYCTEL